MSTRIACLFVPMFPLAARLRSEPELLSEAVVIVDGSGGELMEHVSDEDYLAEPVRP